MEEQQERNALEGIRAIAKMTRAYYEELVTQGFTPQEALMLTCTWLQASARRAADPS